MTEATNLKSIKYPGSPKMVSTIAGNKVCYAAIDFSIHHKITTI